jgi:hypothetical protein
MAKESFEVQPARLFFTSLTLDEKKEERVLLQQG